MNLLFFCGSLEPGRDGVGDYTRRLAGECAARGHRCTVVALHDPHAGPAGELTPDGVRLVRLAAAEPWPDRLAQATALRRRFAPDWVSWQLVAQGLQPRGFLPAALLQAAPELRGPRCHVMLHELWLGLEAGAGWRARAVGWLQRRGVLCLLDQLGPERVHTSNSAYQEALRREGVEAGVLELFGNIPIAQGSPGWRDPLARWRAASVGTPAPFAALTFGTLHPQWRPAATVAWLLATARRLGRPPLFLAVGRVGSRAAGILDAFRRAGVPVALTGELEPEDVSQLLGAATLGIALHPLALIGKSGAAAAMLEHGLPVLVPRDDWRLRGAGLPPADRVDPLLARLAGLGDGAADRWLAARRPPASFLPRTADALLQALGCAPPLSSPLPA